MSRTKTTPIKPDYSARTVGRRKGSRVRFWDAATATLSKWTTDPLYVPQNDAQSLTAEALSTTTVATLRDMAKARGIKVSSKARKSDIIAALTEG